jgi:probable phosphoglycerate mutase
MKVFFVRHGHSVLNGKGIHQPPDTKLSETGIKQAEAIAERFVGVDVDVILSSRYERAAHTARIISKRIDRPVVYTALLNEFKNPSEIEGKKNDSAYSMKVKKAYKEHSNDPGWHYSDEENTFDRIARGRKVVRYIEDRKEEHVLVCTHSGLIRMILAVGLFGDSLNPENFDKVVKFMRTENTGITECEIRPDGRWQLITFNDFVHLK